MEGVEELNLHNRWDFLNPFTWSKRTVRIVTVAFFTIMLPLYLFIGIQPADSLSRESYPSLKISSINLDTPVAPITLENRQLIAPDTIAGSFTQASNKTLLIGHSSTVFENLHDLKLNAILSYDNELYRVTSLKTLEKSKVKMSEVLAPAEQKTLILMTCAGDPLPNQDATHRLLITAEILET